MNSELISKAYKLVTSLSRPGFELVLNQLQQGEKNVTELTISMRVYEQCEISLYLMHLRGFKLVHTRRSGKQIYYSINREKYLKTWSAIIELGGLLRS